MSSEFAFDCGCKFKILNNIVSEEFPRIEFSGKLDELDLSCQRTWDMISTGNTKGCFQLESRLGQSMAKRLKPGNIEELSALISILRPGCLEATRDGKSVSNHYIDKKNNEESIDYFHPILEQSLKTTYGEMIYQEQSMEIAKTIAGFDLKEADVLRKAIGKKKPELMAQMKLKFLDGCKKQDIVDVQTAEQIFDWIEKAQRYQFNKSHSVSYAMNAYLSAYAKAHFPKVFFASYLRFARDKVDPQREIKELVKNASEMDIDVCVPDLRKLNKLFILKDKKIYFGLTDIKGVGESVYNKILDITKDKNIYEMTWTDILTGILLKINSTASKAMVSCGALDFLKKNRTELLFQLEICSGLTNKEQDALRELITNNPKESLENNISAIKTKARITKKRQDVIDSIVRSIQEPPYSLVDKIEWLSDSENALLGVSITCFKIETYDISMTNCDCKEFKTTRIRNNIIIAGEISYIGITKTKKGASPGLEMAFLTIEDRNGSLDSVVFFPECFSKYRNYLFEGNVLIFMGSRGKNQDSLIVEKCFIPSS